MAATKNSGPPAMGKNFTLPYPYNTASPQPAMDPWTVGSFPSWAVSLKQASNISGVGLRGQAKAVRGSL
ncbi:hypothetical protein CEP54_011848 [Fusarium duplospermum]|uniref:Uncharacterized protein n=1 Tax=Fusarium duplospermum TaxID=1325734 RepID=A0A428PC63_9HYPO|nr:hypothetical protein CEP54_011848 [Fusarium duplospermum]